MPILPLIQSTSPTLAEAMRVCMLRAGLSRVQGIDVYVLGNPKAWLGTAYHRVLERLPELIAAGSGAMALLDVLWNEEIERLAQHASEHPLNRRFGEPPFWRGYHLVLATLRLRVKEMIGSNRGPVRQSTACQQHTLREQDVSAFGGRLKGKPDLARADDIIDFKTGSIYETDDLESPVALKQAYVRQLCIYGYLIHHATGRWAQRGLLYPIAGPPVQVNLEPGACTHEATEAVELLDRYNDAVAGAKDQNELASPSPESCKWCPYKIVCPAFWRTANESWAGRLNGEAVAGRLTRAPQAVHTDMAFALAIDADAGTSPPGPTALTPFPAAVHGVLAGLIEGSHVRVVSLGRRTNGQMFPTLWTVAIPMALAPLFPTTS